MGGNVYIIDTSSLIQLWSFNRKVFETLWLKIEGLIDSKLLISPEIVLNVELKTKIGAKTPLFVWARKHKEMFIKITTEQLVALKEVTNSYPSWVNVDSLKNQADPYVVALAIVKKRQKQRNIRYGNVIVITQESQDPGRLKIPKVCKDYGIESTNLDGLFLKEDWKF